MAPSKVVPLFLYPLLLLIPLITVSTADNTTLPPLPPGFKKYFYYQTLDHFSYAEVGYERFLQRYIVSHENWAGQNSTAPIMVYLAPEGPLDVTKAGFINDNSATFKSLNVFIEHRFYGESKPTKTMEESLNNETLRGYFNSAQALADYAEIILYVRRVYAEHLAPVIVVGESYGGMLAAWFRLKYPHLTIGALASSAPILYFDKITPQNKYDLIIAKDYNDTSKSCYQSIRNSWAKIDEVASAPDGLSILSKKFQTCLPLNNSGELKNYLESIYEEAAQQDSPPIFPVYLLCKKIDDDSSNETDILDRIYNAVAAYRGNVSCQDIFYYNRPTEASIGWNWQTCTEMVMPIGSASENDTLFQAPSIFRLGRFKRRCNMKWEAKTKPYWITTYYGGHSINLVLKRFGGNIIFSNGLRDPDSAGGVLRNISDSIVALTTLYGSNSLDMRPAEDTDPIWLRKQREAEVNIIKGWIQTYNEDLRKLR